MPLLGNIGSPKEVIVMWHGLLADIPKGWALCDGTNGTPDLLARFVVSVLNSSTEPGTLGGNDTITLAIAELPTHSHSVTEGTHNHDFTNASGSTGSGAFRTGVGLGDTSTIQETTSNETTGVSASNTGSGSTIENRPVFFEIAYIQQIT